MHYFEDTTTSNIDSVRRCRKRSRIMLIAQHGFETAHCIHGPVQKAKVRIFYQVPGKGLPDYIDVQYDHAAIRATAEALDKIGAVLVHSIPYGDPFGDDYRCGYDLFGGTICNE